MNSWSVDFRVAGQPCVRLAPANAYYCVICGGGLAKSNIYPTCGLCYEAATGASKRRRLEGPEQGLDTTQGTTNGKGKDEYKGDEGISGPPSRGEDATATASRAMASGGLQPPLG